LAPPVDAALSVLVSLISDNRGSASRNPGLMDGIPLGFCQMIR
jgi:hypothetical protein